MAQPQCAPYNARSLESREERMRLVSFVAADKPSYGIQVESGIVDAGARLGEKYASLREVLLAGALDELAAFENAAQDYSSDGIRYLPPIPDPAAKFLCVGINYMPHIEEMGRERPDYPVIFVRFANSLVGHEEDMVLPRASERYDYEGELAVIIGKPARHVPAERAFDYVAGYSCFNDGSLRDYQRHGAQWTPGKNFHHSGAFGPWLLTSDEAGAPDEFHLCTRLNDEVMQSESVAELCFGIPALIEYCSTWAQLEPGDVLVTGTPGGVGAGREPPVWMRVGDRVSVDITGVGELRNYIVAEAGG